MSYPMVCLWLITAGTFGASALAKIRGRAAFAGFRDSVQVVGGVPGRYAVPVALAVVGLELAVAATAAVPRTAPAALGLAALMLTGFTQVLRRALRRRVAISCHCFGAGAEPISGRQVARNLVLLAVAVAGLFLALLTGPPRVSGPGLLLCLLVAGAVVLAVVLLDDIAALLRPAHP